MPGNAAARIRDVASDGVDVIVEVAAGASAELDQAVLRPRGTISIYANDGGAPFNLDVRRNMGLNSRYQFVLLYTVGWDRITAAAADLNHAIEDGAFRVGEEAGLPLHRFNLEDAPAAHAAVERAADKLPGLGHRFEEDVGVAEGVALDLRQRFPVGGVVVNQRDVLHASLLSIVWLLSEVGRSGRCVLDIARKIIRMCRDRGRGSDSSTDPPDRGGTEHMISIWDHDIARQRQQELLAAAERHRLARIAHDQNAQARTGYCKTAYAALLARVPGGRSTPGEGGQCAPSLPRGGM